ncbi:DNA-processing protein DprA [Deltaproteobacteria bacterium TL4]
MKEWKWLALSLISGIGSKTALMLFEHFGSIEAIFQAEPNDLIEHLNLPPLLAQRIQKAESVSSFLMEKRLLEESKDLRLLCWESPEYPTRLKHISTPPLVLYCQGSLKNVEAPCLAFVGSRSCTAYGVRNTRRLIQELAEMLPKVIIVSGLARGIDTIAHQAALEAGLQTIAVLAGGLHHLYPPENKGLADAIKSQGMLISEFPLALKPLSRNFPIRNRIISGLSQGTVISESRKKSGARITAAFALEQNREVFALPGPVDSALSEGPNELIAKHSAQLIVSASDILRELNLVPLNIQTEFSFGFCGSEALSLKSLSKLYQEILKSLDEGISDIDSIHTHTKIEVPTLLGTLVELELMGYVETIGGQNYRLGNNVYLTE